MKKERSTFFILLAILMTVLLGTILLTLHLDKSSQSRQMSETADRPELQWQDEHSMDTVLALMHNGSLAEAEKLLQDAVQKNSAKEDIWMLMGLVQFRQNKFNAAEQSFRRLLLLQPDNAAGYNNLGETLQKQQKIDDALKAFEKAVKLAPDNNEILLNAANLYAENDKTMPAVHLLQKALSNGSTAEDIVRHRKLVRMLEKKEIQNLLKKKLNPDNEIDHL